MIELKTVAEIAIAISSIFSTSVIGVIAFQHRLMWRDFVKRKHINGNGGGGDDHA